MLIQLKISVIDMAYKKSRKPYHKGQNEWETINNKLMHELLLL